MAIKKFLRRRKRAKGEGKAAPFFQGESAGHDEARGEAFFPSREIPLQAKMKVSRPDDPQEKEADKMADKVTHKKEKEEVHKKEKDKEEVQRKDDEDKHTVQKKGKHEEEDKHNHDQLEDHTIATKMNTSGPAPGKAQSRSARADGATALPAGVSHEMSSSFGYDFSNVKIYKGPAAAEASERVGAQAFTYQGDIYFNENKFDPGSEKGRWLLAHELTHVVQQNADTLSRVEKTDVPGISTPVPEKFVVKKKEETIVAAEGTIMGTKVRLLPDITGEVEAGRDGQTSLELAYNIGSPFIVEGKIKRAGKAVVTLVIQTTYREGVDTAAASKYGRGTTAEDKKAGTTSLRFHEGAHGERALVYLKEHPLPKFEGKVGDTVKAYDAAVADFAKRLEAYKNSMLKDNFEKGDCSGSPQPDCP